MSTEPSSLMRAMAAEAGTVMGVEVDAEQLDLLRDPDTGKLPHNVFQLARSRGEARGPGRPAGAKNKKSEQLSKLIVQQFGDPVLGMAAIYAMPLDQLVELLLVADGSKEREDRLIEVVERIERLTARMMDDSDAGRALTDKQVERLDQLVDRAGDLAKVLKTKAGELALKALNTQLAARREVAQYVHGKMPIAVDHTTRADVILNIPGLTDPSHLAQYLDNPDLTPEDLNRLEYADFSDVPAGDGAVSEDDSDAG